MAKILKVYDTLQRDIDSISLCLRTVGGEANKRTLKAHTKLTHARMNRAILYMVSGHLIATFKYNNVLYITSQKEGK